MKQSMSWLSYTKLILQKVSFDQNIFSRELRKSLVKLSKEEIIKLEKWCIKTFPIGLALIATQIVQDYLATAM